MHMLFSGHYCELKPTLHMTWTIATFLEYSPLGHHLQLLSRFRLLKSCISSCSSPLSAVHKSMQSAQIGYAITRETFSRSSISPFYYQWYCKWFFHSRQCLPSDIFGVQPGLEGNCEHQLCKMQLLTSKSHSTSHQKVKAASPASSSMWR